MADSNQLQQRQPDNKVAKLAQLLDRQKGHLAAVLPKTLTPERVAKVACAAVSRSPELLKCSIESLYTAIHDGCSLGFEPGSSLGLYYMVPRWNSKRRVMEAVGQLGYKGLCELAYRHPMVMRVSAENVYEGETFSYDRESGEIRHPFDLSSKVVRNAETLVASYAIVDLRGGVKVAKCRNRFELEQWRDRFASGRRKDGSLAGPWVTDFEAMCRKTALRILLQSGEVPLSLEAQRAVEIETKADETIATDFHVVDAGEPTFEDNRPAADRLADELQNGTTPEEAAKLDLIVGVHEAAAAAGVDPKDVLDEAFSVIGRAADTLTGYTVEELSKLRTAFVDKGRAEA